jgi:selenocysteine-specific elongation factor
MENLIPVHVGLCGHIDHGKTELAKALSEKVSTAGLDKHPQAQERGITIDLGFTMFTLGTYLVTLVDAPGHADLIRSVVAGANIIDAAILTVAADEGPKVQTGEHLIVLQSMGIESLLVAITKTDLVDEKRISTTETKVKDILNGMKFEHIEYSRVSAYLNEGIDDLKASLCSILHKPSRNISGTFLMPIDHAFSIKGHGTVVTGTIQRGRIKSGTDVELMPQGFKAKVRSIQTFGQERTHAQAGDRVGLNLPELKSKGISRGNYLCESGTLRKTANVLIRVNRNPLYSGRVTKQMVLSTMIGMLDITSQIIPIEIERDTKIIKDDTKEDAFNAVLLLNKPVAIDKGMNAILMRTDLPPTSMRIIGSGVVESISDKIALCKRKIRRAKISRIREHDVLVEGLASRKDIAEQLNGQSIRTLSGHIGVLGTPFGTKGVLTAVFKEEVTVGEEVVYEYLTHPEEYRFGI